MGLDDFEPTDNEPIAASDANASFDPDEDLFDFPVPADERLSAEDELADAIEAVEEIAASMLPDLDEPESDTQATAEEAQEEPQLVIPEEVVPEPVASESTEVESTSSQSSEGEALDEDLFGFESIDSTPPARTEDLEENLEEVFGIDVDEPLGLDDAIGELLDAEDDLARVETTPQSKEAAPAAQSAPASQPTNPTPEPSAPEQALEPVATAKTITPSPAPALSSAASVSAPDAPELFEDEDSATESRALRAAAFAKTTFSGLRNRFSGAPLLWLIGLMISTNLLMLVIFWSSLGDVRDLVVETVHKVASAPAPALPRTAPLRQTLERSAPTVQAANPDEETLTAQETLATSQELITAGEFTRARTGLFRLLARIDAVSPEYRKPIEAEANHLIGETYRGQADVLAAHTESLGERR